MDTSAWGLVVARPMTANAGTDENGNLLESKAAKSVDKSADDDAPPKKKRAPAPKRGRAKRRGYDEDDDEDDDFDNDMDADDVSAMQVDDRYPWG